jgi:hypothetical protein
MQKRTRVAATDCYQSNIRIDDKFHDDNSVIITTVNIGDIYIFLDVLLLDMLHDYCRTHENNQSYIKVSYDKLQFFCRIITEGIHSANPNIYNDERIRLDKEIIYQRILSILTDLSSQKNDNYVVCWNMESKLKEYFEKYYIISQKSEIDGKVSSDTCRNSDDIRPCTDYKNKPASNLVTLATKLDTGFMHEHVDYDYCAAGTDYVTTDMHVQFRYSGHIFAYIVYDKYRGDIAISYRKDIGDARLSLVSSSYLQKNNMVNSIDDNYQKDVDIRKIRNNTEFYTKFDNEKANRTRLFNYILLTFNGDFSQVLYAKALSDFNIIGNVSVVTRDTVMLMTSVLLAHHPIYTGHGKPRAGKLSLLIPNNNINVAITSERVSKSILDHQ